MSTMVSLITGVSIVYSTVFSGADQRKHQRFASLGIVRGNHRPSQRFPFDDVTNVGQVRVLQTTDMGYVLVLSADDQVIIFSNFIECQILWIRFRWSNDMVRKVFRFIEFL